MRVDADREITDFMQDIINHVPAGYYADILFDAYENTSIRKGISGETVASPYRRGLAFRIFNGKEFLEIADSDLYGGKRRVLELLQNMEKKSDLKLAEYPKLSINQELPMKIDIGKISLDEKMAKVREIYKDLHKEDSRIINPVVSYQDSLLKRIFLNTEGSVLRQVIPRSRIFLQPIVRVDNKTDFDFSILSGEMGFEIMDGVTLELISQVVKDSIDLALAPLPPSGAFPVVLDPALAGLIAHESFGHGLEADQIIRDRSYLKSHFGKQVASDIVNITDSPVVEGEMGSFLFDDEGIASQKTPLIENGIFTHYLHSRLTASILDAEPRGNGRRESFMHPVHPRMTNTFFESGDMNREELFTGIQNGVMLVKGYFGMEDPLGGGIQCTSRKGYLIENGEVGKLTKGITLSGNVLDLLHSISAVSKDAVELDGGMCGKGTEDFVPVTSGGVYIRADKAIIGPG